MPASLMQHITNTIIMKSHILGS